MLNFQDFFAACSGKWTIERSYHTLPAGDVERSYTEYRVEPLAHPQKQQILAQAAPAGVKVTTATSDEFPGFAIAFDTRSETGETVSMRLQALFVPDAYISSASTAQKLPPPIAADVTPTEDVIHGFYLRDQGYSEPGAAVGRFTYQPTRQTLEMITYYRRSVAVDQMRMVAPNLRLRTIITYQRPDNSDQIPSTIDLVGFGMEQRQDIE